MSGLGTRAHYERSISNDSSYDTSSVQILLDTETHKKSKHHKFVIGIGVAVTCFVILLCIIFVSSKSGGHENLVLRNTTSIGSNSSSTQETSDNKKETNPSININGSNGTVSSLVNIKNDTNATIPDGWYLAAVDENCIDACTSQNLECTEEQFYLHNSDIDSSSEVINLIRKLGGETSVTSCLDWHGKASDVPVYSASQNSCFYSDYTRSLETFDCSRSPNPKSHKKQRLCFCHTAGNLNDTVIESNKKNNAKNDSKVKELASKPDETITLLNELAESGKDRERREKELSAKLDDILDRLNKIGEDTSNQISKLDSKIDGHQSEFEDLKSKADEINTKISLLYSNPNNLFPLKNDVVDDECKEALVSGNEFNILDEKITASSIYDNRHGITRSRLNTQGSSLSGAWSSRVSDGNQWIQAEFQEDVMITGVQTQGRNSDSYLQWVESYKISYSNNGTTWNVFKDDDGTDKVFRGNSNSDTIVTNMLNPPIAKTKFLRISPQTWHSHISLRFDILGCVAKEDVNSTDTSKLTLQIMQMEIQDLKNSIALMDTEFDRINDKIDNLTEMNPLIKENGSNGTGSSLGSVLDGANTTNPVEETTTTMEAIAVVTDTTKVTHHCPSFEGKPFNKMCHGSNMIAMHVTAPHDWSTCRTKCENKANELGKNGCCEARNTNGYCVFRPEGHIITGHNDAKAVSCSVEETTTTMEAISTITDTTEDSRLIKTDVECMSNDKLLGKFSTLSDCSNSCKTTAGCHYFVYGKVPENQGDCYWEKTANEICTEGWERDTKYDFYKQLGPTNARKTIQPTCAKTGFKRLLKGLHCGSKLSSQLKVFIPPTSSDSDALQAVQECENYCLTNDSCWGCSVHCENPCQWIAIKECGLKVKWTGKIVGDITQKVCKD